MENRENGAAGSIFPELGGRALSGREIVFPGSVAGLVTLLALAFRRQAQAQVDSWVEPFVRTFGQREGCAFFEVPMLAGSWKLLAGWIDGGMRGGIPAGRHDHVVTYYGELGGYTRALRMADRSLCYCFLLDRKGVIRWTGKGFADEGLLNAMRETVETLLKKR